MYVKAGNGLGQPRFETADLPTTEEVYQPPAIQESNGRPWYAYLGIGVGVLVIGGIGYAVYKSRK